MPIKDWIDIKSGGRYLGGFRLDEIVGCTLKKKKSG